VFSLSFRDVELILAERGVLVSYESVRRWCRKFGQNFANRMRHRRPRPGDKWYMDEVFIRIQGIQHYLWRAVDQDGIVLDILVQPQRDAKAAVRFFKKLLNSLKYEPRVIVTDKLKSYGVARLQILPTVEHRQSRYVNNRSVSVRPSRTWGSHRAPEWTVCPPFSEARLCSRVPFITVHRTFSIRCAPRGVQRICYRAFIRRCSSHCTVLSVTAVEIGCLDRRADA
jgi:hypothetical protein